MYCEYCGKLLSDYTGICKSCNKITDISNGDPVYDAYRMAQKKKSRDTFVCVFFAVLALTILLSAIIVHDAPYIQESKIRADWQAFMKEVLPEGQRKSDNEHVDVVIDISQYIDPGKEP